MGVRYVSALTRDNFTTVDYIVALTLVFYNSNSTISSAVISGQVGSGNQDTRSSALETKPIEMTFTVERVRDISLLIIVFKLSLSYSTARHI